MSFRPLSTHRRNSGVRNHQHHHQHHHPTVHWSRMLSQKLMPLDLWQLLCVSDIDIIVTVINEPLQRLWFRGLGQEALLLLVARAREIAHWCEETLAKSYITPLPPILDYNAPGSLHQKVLVPLLFSDAHMDFFHGILRMKLRVNKLRLHLSSEKKEPLLCWLRYSALSALHNYISLLLRHEIDCPGKWTWLRYKLHLWIIRNVLFCLK